METVEKEVVKEADGTVEPVDRVAEIAKEAVVKMEETAKEEKITEETKKEESKDASSESSTETEKTKEGKTEVDKVKHGMQKRIDELTKEKNEEKEKREADSQKLADMESNLADMKQKLEADKVIPSDADVIEQEKQDLINKAITEDAEKPEAERREMSEDALEEWLLSDYSKATQWIIKRDIRREKESTAKPVEKDKATDDLDKVHVESRAKLTTKYPKTDVRERGTELKKSGKTNDEVTAILRKENKTFDLMMEIVQSDPKKYAEVANGPELVMQEMDKRLSKDTKQSYTAEEVEEIKKETAKMERDRLAGVDSSFGDSGKSGGSGGAGGSDTPQGYSEKGLALFIKAHRGEKDRNDYIKTLNYGNNIHNSKEMDQEDLDKLR